MTRACAAGNVGGIVLGKLVDRFRHHKAVICAMLVTSCIALAYFTALIQKILPDSWTSGNVGFAQVRVGWNGAGRSRPSITPAGVDPGAMRVETTARCCPCRFLRSAQ